MSLPLYGHTSLRIYTAVARVACAGHGHGRRRVGRPAALGDQVDCEALARTSCHMHRAGRTCALSRYNCRSAR